MLRKLMLCLALAGMTMIPGTLPAFQSKSDSKDHHRGASDGRPQRQGHRGRKSQRAWYG